MKTRAKPEEKGGLDDKPALDGIIYRNEKLKPAAHEVWGFAIRIGASRFQQINNGKLVAHSLLG